MMTKLLRSGALPFTTDPLDKRLKWVKRNDVTRLHEASRRHQISRPVGPHFRHTSQREKASEPGEPTYTFSVGELILLLYVFVPYMDAARDDVRRFRDVTLVLDAAHVFYELIEAEYQSGKPLNEILNGLYIPPCEPQTTAKIQTLLAKRQTEKAAVAAHAETAGMDT